MSVDPGEFSALMALVAQGYPQAAAQLFNLYKDGVLGVIRSHLNRHKRLRSRLDAEDVSQNVWIDLFANPSKCQDFTAHAEFVKYIKGIAYHKADKAIRKHLDTQKRDLRREHHLSEPGLAAAAYAIVDPHPPLGQRIASEEEWDRWLFSLTSDEQRVILMLRAGFSRRETAAEVGCSERSIERLIASIREKTPPENIPNL